MKKILFASLLSVILLFSACGSPSKQTAASRSTTETSTAESSSTTVSETASSTSTPMSNETSTSFTESAVQSTQEATQTTPQTTVEAPSSSSESSAPAESTADTSQLEASYYQSIKAAWQNQAYYISTIEDPNVKQSVQSPNSAATAEATRLETEHPEHEEIIERALQQVLNGD
ncbi:MULTISPECIES: hypothetical protein [unclassified Enterococcus]|uniref:hypothetical protein n=1 Tax=unclassified Enterococcus TaxID=2608891 RepID=UPI0013ED1E43|nr:MULTISPECIES: hypothetical protein [unclassified Enterococcus]